MAHLFTPDEGEGPCIVCGGKLDPVHFAVCLRCMKPFHLRMTEAASIALECGSTYIDETNFTLRFLCDNCLMTQANQQLKLK